MLEMTPNEKNALNKHLGVGFASLDKETINTLLDGL
jgi:hypothetical protein